jgi:hypothetical protein
VKIVDDEEDGRPRASLEESPEPMGREALQLGESFRGIGEEGLLIVAELLLEG